MFWEFVILGALIVLGFGVAIFMARRTKQAPPPTLVQGSQIDLEEFATKIARAVGKEIAEELAKHLVVGPLIGGHQGAKHGIDIEMDESLIPISVEVEVDTTNLEGMVTEEEKADDKLQDAKAKLAKLKGRK